MGSIDVVAQPALAKQLIGIVSQQNTLDRQLTVWENLYFHGRLFGISAADSRRTADELLEKLHLSKWAKASVYALSGGMAQRLMMARAIFHRPAVLFLDEPTAGLDPQSRLALWEILGELNREGQTILLDDPLHGGGRRALRPPGDHGSRQDPRARHPRGAQALGGSGHDRDGESRGRTLQGLADGSPAAIGEVTRTRTIEGGVELHVREAERLVPRVVNVAEAAGFELADLSVSKPSLETVFISLTGKELRD